MSGVEVIALVLAVGLLLYLSAALVVPERFE